MSQEIRVPRLGWSMETGVFVRWLKRDGEPVKVGEPLYELEGDKATQEVEALQAGVLHIPPEAPEPGSEVAVGCLLGWIASTDAAMDQVQPIVQQPARSSAEHSLPAPAASESRRHTTAAAKPSTPRARRVAAELGVNWNAVEGTGRGGRVREKDVRAAARPSVNHFRVVGHSTRRRTIAKRLIASAQQTAPVTLTRRVDATNLVSLRRQFKSASAEIVPSYTDIVARLVAASLVRHPALAGRWEDEQLILPSGEIHIGLAVDTDEGLLVPVLRNVASASLVDVARQSQRLIASARNGSLSAADMEGGVFTITNLGAMGIEAFTPIINLPEVAILGLGAIRRAPVVLDDDRVVPRDEMTLSLTIDHRAIDGAPAARFLQYVASAIENPSAFLLL